MISIFHVALSAIPQALWHRGHLVDAEGYHVPGAMGVKI
jgi:hypothetical protein